MSFFDMVTKKVSETAKAAGQKSSELVELTKLNLAISSEEEKMANIFVEIGKAVYGSYADGDEVDELARPFCEEIDECESRIQLNRRKIADLKKTTHCQACGTAVKKENTYCPKCGIKL